jgi:hypothetical protein
MGFYIIVWFCILALLIATYLYEDIRILAAFGIFIFSTLFGAGIIEDDMDKTHIKNESYKGYIIDTLKTYSNNKVIKKIYRVRIKK